jgi:hypothetical protein
MAISPPPSAYLQCAREGAGTGGVGWLEGRVGRWIDEWISGGAETGNRDVKGKREKGKKGKREKITKKREKQERRNTKREHGGQKSKKGQRTKDKGKRKKEKRKCCTHRIGDPPSWITVPYAVGVKKAGTPAPPARTRSASVPCGVSSTDSSPERNCRSNSAFSPTYDEIILEICLVA